MSINAAQLQTYLDSELLIIYRWALANGAAGTTRSIQGRSITFPSTKDIWKTIARLEQRIQDDANLLSGQSGNVSVVVFDDPT
jgi:hypothetical protein